MTYTNKCKIYIKINKSKHILLHTDNSLLSKHFQGEPPPPYSSDHNQPKKRKLI